MSVGTIRILLAAFAGYMVWKTASAPRRGTFLTLFGNTDRRTHPRAFILCLIGGYCLAALFLLVAVAPDCWLPALAGTWTG